MLIDNFCVILALGLFHRVIMASGSLLSPWHLPTNQFKSSEKIISLLGCYSDYSKSMMQCLRSKRTVEILKAYEEYIEVSFFYNYQNFVFIFLFLTEWKCS